MLRFVKRRNPALRPPIRPDGIILLEGATRNWRERLKALKEAQEIEESRPEAPHESGPDTSAQ